MASAEAVWNEIETAKQMGPTFDADANTRQLADRIAPVAREAEHNSPAALSLLGEYLGEASKNGSIVKLAGELSRRSVDQDFGEALAILTPDNKLAAIDFVGGGPNVGGPNVVRCDASNWKCEAVAIPRDKK